MTKDDGRPSRESLLNELRIQDRTLNMFYDLVYGLDSLTLDSYNAWCVMVNDWVTRASLSGEDIKQFLRDRIDEEQHCEQTNGD